MSVTEELTTLPHPPLSDVLKYKFNVEYKYAIYVSLKIDYYINRNLYSSYYYEKRYKF